MGWICEWFARRRGQRIIVEIATPADYRSPGMLNVTTSLADNQSQKAHIIVTDKAGHPDMTDAAVWSSGDTGVCEVSMTDPNDPTSVADPAGRVAWLKAKSPGSCSVSVSVSGLTLSISVSVTPSTPADIITTFDPPVDNP